MGVGWNEMSLKVPCKANCDYVIEVPDFSEKK